MLYEYTLPTAFLDIHVYTCVFNVGCGLWRNGEAGDELRTLCKDEHLCTFSRNAIEQGSFAFNDIL